MNDVYVAGVGIRGYIRYYNHERIKLRLQGLSPVECRLKMVA